MTDYIFGILAVNRKEWGTADTIGIMMNSLANSRFWRQAGGFPFVIFDGGSTDLSYLDRYRSFAEVHRTKEAASKYTQARAFRSLFEHCVVGGKAKYAVLMEDDILFCKNWFLNMDRWLRKYEGSSWMYPLYAPYEPVREAVERGEDSWKYRTSDFYGNQCLVFDNAKAERLVDHLEPTTQGDYILADIVLSIALRACGQEHVLTCCPSLVQHQQGVSVLESPAHGAWAFPGEDVDPKLAVGQ